MLHSAGRNASIPTITAKASHSGTNSKHTNNRIYKHQEQQQQQQKSYNLVQPSLQQTNGSSSSTGTNSSNNSNATEPLCAPSTTTMILSSSSSSSSSTTDTPPELVRIQTNTTENVQVAVRCRPLSPKENLGKDDNAWHINTSHAKIQLTDSAATTRRPQQHISHLQQRHEKPSRNMEYYFDNVAYGSDNNALYQTSVKPLIGQAMDGYNATVFAYGQTASGKTYTMMGTESERGIIPRAVDEIFSYIKTAVNNEFLLRVSYLEIYNETIRDLLEPENDNLKIHESKQRGVYVTPMREEVVTCSQDVLNVIQLGEGNRHISTTDYNLHSSRSHTIFQMVIESRQRSRENSATTISRPSRTLLNRNGTKESVKISQLNLIDLAGSEKAASNQDRRKEGTYINKSLLTLGTVISKLTETGKRSGHVPFRDSKLTRILQPSLSGHAKVVVICTISPHIVAVDESINTLKFATRVKKIVLTAKNDAVMDDKALLQQYRSEIMELKLKLQTANDVLLEEQQSKQSMITAERQQYEQELFQMRTVRSALKKRIDHLTKMILTSTSVTIPPANDDATNTTDNPATMATLPLEDDGEQQQQQDDHDEQQQVSQLSDMDIINAITAATTTATSDKTMTHGDASNNPWVLVRHLRHEIHELRQNNEQLQQQLSMNHERLEQLQSDFNDKTYLRNKVANLEAELSVTKAELEITSQMTNDMDDGITLGSNDHAVYV